MLTCQDCGRDDIMSPAGMASHRRSKHPDGGSPEVKIDAGPNVQAVEVTLAELERIGRLEQIDTARVMAVRSIAVALDANPFNSQMWREYREALKELAADGDDGDGIEALLRELSGADTRDASTP